MSASPSFQLLFALAIVVIALAVLGYRIWLNVRALGLLRDDFDRRAPWIALGVIVGGALVYWKMAR